MKFRSILGALLMTTGTLVVTAGPAQAISTCDDPIPPPSCAPNEGPPEGRIDAIQRIPNGVRVIGWAADPDAEKSTVRVKINGVTAGILTAGKPYPNHGNTGFDGVVAAKSGDQVCISVPNLPNGGEMVVDCETWQVRYDPFGNWTTMDRTGDSLSLSGWTLDPDSADPLVVVAHRDGTQVAAFNADVPRADVAAANPGYGPNHGFSAMLPEGPEGDHQLCLTAINISTGTDISLGCRWYTVDHNPNGSLDSVTRTADKVVVKGWAVDPDSPTTPILVDLGVDGKYVRTTTADLDRPDVGQTVPQYGSKHGYEFTIDAADSGTHEVCILGWNSGPGAHTMIGCKSYSRPAALTAPVMEPLVKDHTQYYGRNEVRWGVGDQVVNHVKVEKSITEGSWGTVYDQDSSIRQWVDTNAGTGQRACYRVTISNDRPGSAQSVVCGVSLLPAPEGPTDTRVTAVGDTTVSLAWTDRATAENGYRVDVSAPGIPSRSINLPGNTSTYTVTGLDRLTAYTFLVRPVQDNAANVEDAQAGRATATTTGAIVITSFTANPTQVTACKAVDVNLTYSVAGANRVKVERVVGTTVTTVFDQTHGLEQWDNTISGGSNDGGLNYVITAYGPNNTSVRKALTVGRSSQNLMANTILFYNNSNSVMNVGFYDASGTVLITDLGQVAAKQYKRIQLPSCQKVLVGAKAPFVQDWIYLQTWLGHTAEGEKTAELHNYPQP